MFVFILFPDDTICASSVALYFKNNGFDTEELPVSHKTRSHSDLQLPEVDSVNYEGSETSCDFEHFYEWLGGVACGVDW